MGGARRFHGDGFERLALALLGGAMLAAPHLWRPLWPLAWVGAVPWLLLLTHPQWNRPRPLSPWWGLPGSVALAFLGCVLALAPAGWLPALVQPLFYVPFYFLPLVLLALIHRRLGTPLVLLWPALWVGAEFLWSRLALGQLEFLLTAYGQAGFLPLVQFADLTGQWGVTVLVMSANGAITDLLLAAAAPEKPLAWRRARRMAILVGILVLAALAYGLIRPRFLRWEDGPRVVLLQTNERRGLTTRRESFLSSLGMVRREVRRGEADLAVLPENSLEDFLEKPEFLADAIETQKTTGVPLLLGAYGVHPDFEGRHLEAIERGEWPFTNAGFLLDAGGRITAVWHKIHLLPWTEYIPGNRLLARLKPAWATAQKNLVRRALGFGGVARPGPGVEVHGIPALGREYRIWAPICFETSDTRLVRAAARAGTDFYLNIASEGRLGPQMFWNMVSVCQIRAIETRRSIARAANTGITCLITPDGRIDSLLRVDGRPWFVQGALPVTIPIVRGGTPPAVHVGDSIPFAALALILGLLGRILIRPSRPPA